MDRIRSAPSVAVASAVVILLAAAWTTGWSRAKDRNRPRAPPGIRNVGNTCFANAVLQAMASSNALIQFLWNSLSGKKRDEIPLVYALWSCLHDLNETRRKGKSVDAKNVLQALERHLNQGFDFEEQQDASEFFEMLCDAVSMEVEDATRARLVPGDHANHPQGDPSEEITVQDGGNHSPRVLEEPPEQQSSYEHESRRHADLQKEHPPTPSEDVNKGPFEGSTASTSICFRCASRSTVNLQRFIVLHLAIPYRRLCGTCLTESGLTLETLLHQFTSLEMVEGVVCSVCSHNATLRNWDNLEGKGETTEEEVLHAVETIRKCSVVEVCSCQKIAEVVGLRWEKSYATGGRRLLLARVPELLCIQLRRASYVAGRLDKVLGHVSFPEQLVLTPFTMNHVLEAGQQTRLNNEGIHAITEQCWEDNNPMSSTKESYTLQSVIVHHGEGRRGHYTVYRRMMLPTKLSKCKGTSPNALLKKKGRHMEPEMEETWFSISDTDVSRVQKSVVFSCDATVLLYERTVSSG